jgi:Relaxase/Mobilisation nuclease domain
VTKRIVDLSFGEEPLLDIGAYARGSRVVTPIRRLQIALTVHRAPEVMVKVSGGARTVVGVGQHMAYVGREGDLGLEMDTGPRLVGKGFEQQLISDWDLEIEEVDRRSAAANARRRPVKLVHNLIFSMPPGTSPKAVLKAVKKLAANEWALKHRYALALHTDEKHPHVHVVLKAVSEKGDRLNIRKATLRSWRSQFAANLRELGVTANATERSVRGQTRSYKRDPIFRADQHGESTHVLRKQTQVVMELVGGKLQVEHGRQALVRTGEDVRAGWRRLSAILESNGDHALADAVRDFESRLAPPRTDKEWLARDMVSGYKKRTDRQRDAPTR